MGEMQIGIATRILIVAGGEYCMRRRGEARIKHIYDVVMMTYS